MSLFGISAEEKVNFAKNFSVMLKSGITLDEALVSLAEQTESNKFRKIILEIKSNVDRGTALSEAFGKYPEFDSVFRALLRTGEVSGTLEENLIFLSDWLERQQDLRKEISAAILYPKIIFGATLILGAVLILFVLPKLVPLFTDFGVELPLATRVLVNVAKWAQKFWYLVIGFVVFLIAFLALTKRIKSVRVMIDLIAIKIPFFGRLIIDYQLALISQLFFTCFKSSLSLKEILDIIGDAATNVYYRNSLQRMSERIEKGINLSDTMKEYPKLYPKQLVNIIATGEKSGTLTNSFSYLADFYTKEVRSKTKKIPTVIEPVLLIFIAVVIGLIAFAIIMPIYKLTLSVSR